MKEYGAEQSVRRIGHAPSGAVELLCARPAVAAAVGVGSKAGGGAVDLAVYTGAVLDSLSTPSRTFSLSLSVYPVGNNSRSAWKVPQIHHSLLPLCCCRHRFAFLIHSLDAALGPPPCPLVIDYRFDRVVFPPREYGSAGSATELRMSCGLGSPHWLFSGLFNRPCHDVVELCSLGLSLFSAIHCTSQRGRPTSALCF